MLLLREVKVHVANIHHSIAAAEFVGKSRGCFKRLLMRFTDSGAEYEG